MPLCFFRAYCKGDIPCVLGIKDAGSSYFTLSNGFNPVLISRRTQPKLQISLLYESRPFSCSGDMYLSVPQPAILGSIMVASNLLETPKSTNFAILWSALSRILWGFISWWIIFLPWRYFRAEINWSPIFLIVSIFMYLKFFYLMKLSRSLPPICSMTMLNSQVLLVLS